MKLKTKRWLFTHMTGVFAVYFSLKNYGRVRRYATSLLKKEITYDEYVEKVEVLAEERLKQELGEA